MTLNKRVLLVLALGCGSCVNAQPTFEKMWFTSGTAKLNLIELPSHDVLVGMAQGPGVSRMDPQGFVVQSNHYWSDSLVRQQSVRQRSANEFSFVSGCYFDSCSSVFSYIIPFIHPVIGSMDSLGNVHSVHYYAMNTEACGSTPRDLEFTADGGIVVWGRDKYFFVLKVNQKGIPVWARHFGYDHPIIPDVGHSGSFQFIKELPSGDLLAGINMDTAGVVVARMNADGDFLWCRSYMPEGMVHDCVVESDDSFIITGATDTTNQYNAFEPLPPSYHPKLFMMKLNGGGEVQWCKGYDSAPYLWYASGQSRILKAQDGNYVWLANLGVQGYNRSFRPMMMKLDQNGDTLWTRSVGRTGYTHEIVDLLAYSDGGFIFNGVIAGDLPENNTGVPFIFKTDSLGHLPCYEHHYPVVLSDLFPTDSSFTLSSTDGATMHELFVGDTTFAPITVYDGCTFTTGFSQMEVRKWQSPRIRPNPNTGRFTLEFQDPLLAESYYSVYDAVGKLLYQRPLRTGATLEEVDLGRFGPGTYVVHFTSKEGTCYERVVVE